MCVTVYVYVCAHTCVHACVHIWVLCACVKNGAKVVERSSALRYIGNCFKIITEMSIV